MRYRDLREFKELDGKTREVYETLAILRHVRRNDGLNPVDADRLVANGTTMQQLDKLESEGLLCRGSRGILFWKRPTYGITQKGYDVFSQVAATVARLAEGIEGKPEGDATAYLAHEGYAPGEYALTRLIIEGDIGLGDLQRGGIEAKVIRGMDVRERARERSVLSRIRTRTETRAYDDFPVYDGGIERVLDGVTPYVVDAAHQPHFSGGEFGGAGASASFESSHDAGGFDGGFGGGDCGGGDCGGGD